MDVNQDGRVDIGDLVRQLAAPTTAHFLSSSSDVREGSGTVSVQVVFTEPFTGDLHYNILDDEYNPLSGEVGTSAMANSDYSPLPGVVQGLSKASSASIDVLLLEDDQFEREEAIVIALNNASDYLLRPPHVHEIIIEDNDMPLEGVWTAIVNRVLLPRS